MKKKPIRFDNIPGPALVTGSIILAALIVHGLFFLFPRHRELSLLKHQAAAASMELERLRVLFPVQARIKGLESIDFSPKLKLSAPAPISRDGVDALMDRFRQSARIRRLNLVKSRFDLEDLDNDSSDLPITLTLHGSMADLRHFLTDIIGLPCFGKTCHITIDHGQAHLRHMAVSFKIRIMKAPDA